MAQFRCKYLTLKKLKKIFLFLSPFIIFFLISLFLCYKLITLPNIVIGDSFHWTKNTLHDLLGLKVIRETYMGDVAILSTFKTGFLLPICLLIDSLNLSFSFVYPLLFYFLAMTKRLVCPLLRLRFELRSKRYPAFLIN